MSMTLVPGLLIFIWFCKIERKFESVTLIPCYADYGVVYRSAWALFSVKQTSPLCASQTKHTRVDLMPINPSSRQITHPLK